MRKVLDLSHLEWSKCTLYKIYWGLTMFLVCPTSPKPTAGDENPIDSTVTTCHKGHPWRSDVAFCPWHRCLSEAHSAVWRKRVPDLSVWRVWKHQIPCIDGTVNTSEYCQWVEASGQTPNDVAKLQALSDVSRIETYNRMTQRSGRQTNIRQKVKSLV